MCTTKDVVYYSDRKGLVVWKDNVPTHRCTDDFNGAQLKGVCVEAGI